MLRVCGWSSEIGTHPPFPSFSPSFIFFPHFLPVSFRHTQHWLSTLSALLSMPS